MSNKLSNIIQEVKEILKNKYTLPNIITKNILIEFIDRVINYENNPLNIIPSVPYKSKPAKSRLDLLPKPEKKEEFIEPEPVKAPENLKPVVNNIEEKIKKLEELGSKKGAVSYNSETILGSIAFVNFLKKYSSSCAVLNVYDTLNNNRDTTISGIIINTIKKQSNIFLEPQLERLGKSLSDCVKRGIEVICIPLTLFFGKKNGGHANMLIYRPFKRIVERFEPHGQSYGNSTSNNDSINNQLKDLWENNKILKSYIGDVRFREPADICPNPKGFQSLESEIKSLKSEGGGFCSMWSIFIAEMTIMNPDKSTKEIIDEVFTITNREPAYLKSVIRGYVLEIEDGLDKLLKIIMNKGFSFKSSTSDGLKTNKDALDKWILSVVFDNGKYSKAPPQFEPLPNTEIRDKSDIEKLKETYLNKIKSFKRHEYDALLNVYGLGLPKSVKVKDMGPFIIEQLYMNEKYRQYGVTGLKDIDIILEEELHKKKGAYKWGLARDGYFLNK
jgi:hypothetical protein